MARHLNLIDEAIRKLVLREIPERVLVIRLPPRHGKSEIVSHWTPAWFEANWPEKNVLLATYEATFAASWGRKARDAFVEATALSPQTLLGRISRDRTASNDWGTNAGGYMATAGVGGPFTGKGFHLGVCDDLIKNHKEAQSEVYREATWEWFTSTFWSRREPDGVLIVIGTPWHRDDYLARLRTWAEPIREICLPALCEAESDLLGRKPGEALWPERYNEDELESIRKSQGPYNWNALYQQRPSQHEHAEWGPEYFEDIWCERLPAEPVIRVVALDPSLGKTDKADYSAFVCASKGQDGCYYIDADIRRRPSSEIVRDGVAWMARLRPDAFGCETNQFQELLRSMFEDAIDQAGMNMTQVFGIHNHMHKITRIRALSELLRRKRLKFVTGSPGAALLVSQLQDFPLGDYDDGPDALEMAIRLAERLLRGTGLENPTDERVYA